MLLTSHALLCVVARRLQYMHIPDRDRCNWLRERIETPELEPFSTQKKLHTLDRLAWSDMFETFLANKYEALTA